MNVIPQPTPAPRPAGRGGAIGALNPPSAETILAAEADATNAPDEANGEATPSAGKTTLDWANYYHNLGLPVFPLEPGGKRPAFVVVGGRSQRVRWKVFQDRLAMDEERREWFSGGTNNVAVVSCPLAKLVVLDFDAETGKMLLGLLQQLGLPRAPTVHSPGGGRHLYFRAPENDVLIHPRENWLPGLDPRGYGSYVAAPPSIGANGRPYAWDVDDHIEELPPPQLPDWVIEILIAPTTTIARDLFKRRLMEHFGEQDGGDKFLELLALETCEATEKTARRAPVSPHMAWNKNQPNLSGQILDDQGLIVDGRKRYAANVVWGRLAQYIREEGKYPSVEELTELAWEIYVRKVDHRRKPSPTREGILSMAKYALKRARSGMLPPPEEAKEGKTPAEAADPRKELSEESVARVFESQYRDELRYVEESDRWIRWKDNFWEPARKGLAFYYARELVRSMNRDERHTVRFATGKALFINGVETCAKHGDLAIQMRDLDRDPWLLATPGGTVDLRTGKIRAAKREDYCTRCTAIGPAPIGTIAPTWQNFLRDATDGDTDLIGFLQRWAGYCLTGVTREHTLLFVYGPGGNGKSVFVNTLAGIMGDYSTVAAMETFTAQHGDRHPTDLAMLSGARLVTASETEEGRAWAESRIKQMTGGDPITARFMRQNFFTYIPQFKLTIVGNHKPALKNVDEAARRRVRIVPFVRKPAVPDRLLPDKLRAEWPAILRWMIDGCVAWQQGGLGQAAAVEAATEDYFEAQDAFGAWVAERCIFDCSLTTSPATLLGDFNSWAQANGERPTNRNRFRGWLDKQRNLRYKIVRGARLVEGVGLRPPENSSHWVG